MVDNVPQQHTLASLTVVKTLVRIHLSVSYSSPSMPCRGSWEHYAEGRTCIHIHAHVLGDKNDFCAVFVKGLDFAAEAEGRRSLGDYETVGAYALDGDVAVFVDVPEFVQNPQRVLGVVRAELVGLRLVDECPCMAETPPAIFGRGTTPFRFVVGAMDRIGKVVALSTGVPPFRSTSCQARWLRADRRSWRSSPTRVNTRVSTLMTCTLI